MNSTKFIDKLLVSYRPDKRPDKDFVDELKSVLRNRILSAEQWQSALEAIQQDYSWFPSIQEITSALAEAVRKSKSKNPHEVAMESFKLGDIQYARPVPISASGVPMRHELPDGAYDVHLALPSSLQAQEETYSLQEAIEEGFISNEFVDSIMGKGTECKRYDHKDRFRKIGEVIGGGATGTYSNQEDEDWDI